MARAVTQIDEPCWVYYVYCEHGGLLYVGVAADVPRRVQQHRKDKKWWRREVHSLIAYHYPTRRQAFEVEAHSIRTYRPHYNISGVAGPEAMPHEVAPHRYDTLTVLDARGRRC